LPWDIELHNLSFKPFDASENILSDINLILKPGERIGIVGPSGSGKTTLCFHLIGLHNVALTGKTQGKLLINDVDVSDLSFEELKAEQGFKPAMLLQNPESQIFSSLVEEEIAYGLQNPEPKLIENVLKEVGLQGYEKRSVKALSLGEKQRVLIATLLAQIPSVLVMDEPTNSLDGIGQARLLESIRPLATTQIMIEHNLKFLCHWAERIVEIRAGRICFDGPVKKWLKETKVQPRFLSAGFSNKSAGKNSSAALCQLSQQSGNVATETDTAQTILKFKKVSFAYTKEKAVFRDTCFEIEKGQTVGVLGLNGSGKTTLFKLICGLKKPDSGTIFFRDQSIEKLKPEDLVGRIGYVYQNPEYQLFEDTVERECHFILRNLKASQDEMQYKTRQWLEFFGLSDLALRSPFSLSYGEKRRLSLASVLISEPEIVLLDEPTTALDESNITALEELIFELSSQQGKTILVATHDLDFARRVADRFLIIENGGQVITKSKQELNPEFCIEKGFQLPITLNAGLNEF
jgi:energy-coupling factor transport system ATP-binding protein